MVSPTVVFALLIPFSYASVFETAHRQLIRTPERRRSFNDYEVDTSMDEQAAIDEEYRPRLDFDGLPNPASDAVKFLNDLVKRDLFKSDPKPRANLLLVTDEDENLGWGGEPEEAFVDNGDVIASDAGPPLSISDPGTGNEKIALVKLNEGLDRLSFKFDTLSTRLDAQFAEQQFKKLIDHPLNALEQKRKAYVARHTSLTREELSRACNLHDVTTIMMEIMRQVNDGYVEKMAAQLNYRPTDLDKLQETLIKKARELVIIGGFCLSKLRPQAEDLDGFYQLNELFNFSTTEVADRVKISKNNVIAINPMIQKELDKIFTQDFLNNFYYTQNQNAHFIQRAIQEASTIANKYEPYHDTALILLADSHEQKFFADINEGRVRGRFHFQVNDTNGNPIVTSLLFVAHNAGEQFTDCRSHEIFVASCPEQRMDGRLASVMAAKRFRHSCSNDDLIGLSSTRAVVYPSHMGRFLTVEVCEQRLRGLILKT